VLDTGMSVSVSRAGVRLAVGVSVLGDAFNAGVSSGAGRRPTGTRGHGNRSTTRGAPPDFGSNAHRPTILSSESGGCKFGGQLQIREALVIPRRDRNRRRRPARSPPLAMAVTVELRYASLPSLLRFVAVHYWMSWVLIGSLLLHIAVQLPAIRSGLAERVWRAPGPAEGLSRRGVLIAGGAGVALVAASTVGQVIPALQPVALLAPRQPRDGPLGVPVNRTAVAAGVIRQAQSPQYRLSVHGPRLFVLTLPELEAEPTVQTTLPIACVEGWSIQAHWRGVRLLDLVRRAGGVSYHQQHFLFRGWSRREPSLERWHQPQAAWMGLKGCRSNVVE